MLGSNKRIAKNTMFMYGRMLVLMAVSLYTSRVVLNALGIIDYGVFNVVGGVVAFVGFLNGSLATSTQRFLNVEMANGNAKTLNETFCQALNAHFIIAIICVVVLQTVGLWFVTNKLVIPQDQHVNAIWVFECSIAIMFVSIISVPYNAAFIANEKMSYYAYLSVLDAAFKLGIAFTILVFPDNKLKYYAILLLCVALIMRFIYIRVAAHSFKECRYRFSWNRKILKKMFSFSGWMIFGTLSDLLAGQGVNMLINIYFGPIFNAARAIAVQVQAAVSQFTSNFMISVNPQIVKMYSAGERFNAFRLVFMSSKLSFILMLMIIIPISVRAEDILTIWLKEVPEYASIFVKIILLEYLIRASYTPIAQINVAHGKIMSYQLAISVLFMIIFLGTIILYKLGYPVYSTFILSVIIAIIGLFVRLRILKKISGFPLGDYLKSITMPCFISLCGAYALSFWISSFISTTFVGTLCCCLISLLISAFCCWFIVLRKSDRENLIERMNMILYRFRNKH